MRGASPQEGGAPLRPGRKVHSGNTCNVYVWCICVCICMCVYVYVYVCVRVRARVRARVRFGYKYQQNRACIQHTPTP